MLKVNYEWNKDGKNWEVVGVVAEVISHCDMKHIRKLQAKAVRRVLRLAQAYNNFTHINARQEELIHDQLVELTQANEVIQELYQSLQVARLSWFVTYMASGSEFRLVGISDNLLAMGYEWLHMTNNTPMRDMTPMQISMTAAKYFFGEGWRVDDGASEPHHTPDNDDGDIPF